MIGMRIKRSKRARHEGVGVTPRELTAGTVVMVPTGDASAVVNGGPCVIAWAVVRGPADDAAVTDPQAKWWLDVHMAPGVVLQQMYRCGQILGVPALGLRMDGAPDRQLT